MIKSVGNIHELDKKGVGRQPSLVFLPIHFVVSSAINLVLINHLCGSPFLGYIKETSSLFRIKKRAMISMIWMLIQSQEIVIQTTGLYLMSSLYVAFLYHFMSLLLGSIRANALRIYDRLPLSST